jgi:hypothetical protein
VTVEPERTTVDALVSALPEAFRPDDGDGDGDGVLHRGAGLPVSAAACVWLTGGRNAGMADRERIVAPSGSELVSIDDSGIFVVDDADVACQSRRRIDLGNRRWRMVESAHATQSLLSSVFATSALGQVDVATSRPFGRSVLRTSNVTPGTSRRRVSAAPRPSRLRRGRTGRS